MKSLNQYIQEKLIINKDYHDNMIVVKSFDELRKIIEDRYDKLGPGTKRNPIDFNDIDVSNLDSFYYNNTLFDKGIFQGTKFKYIDISYWNVSNVTNMRGMFFKCDELESTGDLSNWDVSNVTDMRGMFFACEELKSVGDISKWNVSNVTDMIYMFHGCKSFNQDISKWDVSSVTDMSYMFHDCRSFNQDISKWDVSNVRHRDYIFKYCPIKEEYKPKFK